MLWKLGAVANVSWLIGYAVASVGQMPQNPSKPFSWVLPVAMFLIVGTATFLGYMAGKEE